MKRVLPASLILFLGERFSRCRVSLVERIPTLWGVPQGVFVARLQSNCYLKMSITYRGETFSGYNKPKRTPNHPTKSHAVLAKEGDKVKLIRFGQQGVSGAGSNPKSEKEKARRRSFKARHAKNIARGKMSPAYWADREKW